MVQERPPSDWWETGAQRSVEGALFGCIEIRTHAASRASRTRVISPRLPARRTHAANRAVSRRGTRVDGSSQAPSDLRWKESPQSSPQIATLRTCLIWSHRSNWPNTASLAWPSAVATCTMTGWRRSIWGAICDHREIPGPSLSYVPECSLHRGGPAWSNYQAGSRSGRRWTPLSRTNRGSSTWVAPRGRLHRPGR